MDVRKKGKRAEYEVVGLFKEAGFEAKRVPLSGATQFAKGDVVVSLPDRDMAVEVKIRKSGFEKLYELLLRHESFYLETPYGSYYVLEPDRFFEYLREGVLVAEAHVKARDFKYLSDFTKQTDVVFLRQNRRHFVVVMRA